MEIPNDNRILFFKRDRGEFGFLSNFHDAPITVQGETWQSTEFYYQAQKSHDSRFQNEIRKATSPGHAKGLGSDPSRSRRARRRSWFAQHPDAMRSDWPEVKVTVMRVALAAKFAQNHELREMLLATGDAQLIEDSPHDSFWGTGRDGQGMNQLGRLLMELRTQYSNTTSTQ
jgi:ribA/ribD-fused uncharacterized protein